MTGREQAIQSIRDAWAAKKAELWFALWCGVGLILNATLLLFGTQPGVSPLWTFWGAGWLAYFIVKFRARLRRIDATYGRVIASAERDDTTITVTHHE